MSHSDRRVVFYETGDPRFPYEASVDGEKWTIRVNEFPVEAFVYSLLIDEKIAEELIDWPSAWTRFDREAMEAPKEGAAEEAEYERELSQWERIRNIPPSKRVK